jgi:hypothetical protein
MSEVAKADCAQPVTYLQQGNPAVCTGYLFSPEKELEVRTKVTNYDKMQDLTKQQDELIALLQTRTQVEVDNNLKLSQELSSQRQKDQMSNYLYFFLGALITGAVSYATIRANK